MIEAIINYIRKQGYTVDVREQALVIRKRVGGTLLSMRKGITSAELNDFDVSMAEFVAEFWLREFRTAEESRP